jgi:hypothetical protein
MERAESTGISGRRYNYIKLQSRRPQMKKQLRRPRCIWDINTMDVKLRFSRRVVLRLRCYSCVRLTVEIKVSKEGVTPIIRFEMEEHDNARRLYGEFSWKGVS